MMFVNHEANPERQTAPTEQVMLSSCMAQMELTTSSQRRDKTDASPRFVSTRPFVFFGRGATKRHGSVDCCKHLKRGPIFVPVQETKDQKYDLLGRAVAPSGARLWEGRSISLKAAVSINRYKEVGHEQGEYESPELILKKLRALEKEIAMDLAELEGVLG